MVTFAAVHGGERVLADPQRIVRGEETLHGRKFVDKQLLGARDHPALERCPFIGDAQRGENLVLDGVQVVGHRATIGAG